jgi:CRISPR-associated protein Csm4
MKYKICKMIFSTGIHVGNGMLSDGNPVILADTLFSALCHEALSVENGIAKLHDMCKKGNLRFSDALPFIGDTLYLPKPFISLDSEKDSDSKMKKALKKLSYIPADRFEQYLKGDLNIERETEKFKELGSYEMRTNVSVHRLEDSEPYHIGVYQYCENAGLYILVAYEHEENMEYFLDLLESVSYSGLGGRRSTGLGKLQIIVKKCPEYVTQRLQIKGYQSYMSLSFSMPNNQELMELTSDISYLLIKRSGFVLSNTYAKSPQKKKDFYGFMAGSCTNQCYEGDIYDVSSGGNHPVYRYALPLFMGVTG